MQIFLIVLDLLAKKNRTFVTSFNPITQFTNERICK